MFSSPCQIDKYSYAYLFSHKDLGLIFYFFTYLVASMNNHLKKFGQYFSKLRFSGFY